MRFKSKDLEGLKVCVTQVSWRLRCSDRKPVIIPILLQKPRPFGKVCRKTILLLMATNALRWLEC